MAVDEAIRNGGIDFEGLDKNRIGVIWGSGNGGIQTFTEEMIDYAKRDETPRFNPFFIPKITTKTKNIPLSYFYTARGNAVTTMKRNSCTGYVLF